ncbi:MAG: hypothetical protein EOL89_01170 [Actinobacteria bacterium]|nr:hypothetical protein [Actinomycetota bacterium]
MDVSTVRQKVQHYLTKHGRVELDEDGDFSLRIESARVFIRAAPWGDDETIVNVWCLAVIGASPSPELHEYIAYQTDGYIFGHLGLSKRSDGKVNILFSHRLLGDYLDEAELMNAVIAVAATTNKMDEELAERFGGQTFHEA